MREREDMSQEKKDKIVFTKEDVEKVLYNTKYFEEGNNTGFELERQEKEEGRDIDGMLAKLGSEWKQWFENQKENVEKILKNLEETGNTDEIKEGILEMEKAATEMNAAIEVRKNILNLYAEKSKEK